MSGRKGKKTGMKLVIRILLVVVLILVGIVAYMGYTAWSDSQEVFRDVTVELGTEALGIRDFMTEKAVGSRVSFVTDPAKIDLSQLQETKLVLKHGTKNHTVLLTVQDTQAPTAEVSQQQDVSVMEAMPEAAMLVSNIQDASDVKVYYAQEPAVPEDYSDMDVEVVLEDESGNKTVSVCRFHFTGWLLDSFLVELGQTVTPDQLLTNPEKDQALMEQMDLSAVTTVGEHVITVTTGNTQADCVITVQDTTAPELKLQNVRIQPGETAEAKDFVVSASDLSGEPEISMAGEMPDCSKNGTHVITIEAKDAHGNVATREATLWVSDNMNPPEVKGAEEAMVVEKYSEPDFLAGVYAKDDIDGEIIADVDTLALDMTKAGTYYITYFAMDSSGNTGTYKRKVTVEPDEEDTAALVAEIAETLPDDPEAIRDYVHDLIGYRGDAWGGDDPVWYGLNNHAGNCYVHAHTLQAFLEYKGYETQLIWVTNKSHYWLIIKLDEGWRHIDSTPSSQHEKVGLGTDKVRYQNLNGRNWDRSQWPKCE